MTSPLYREEVSSQIPAVRLLRVKGWTYLPHSEAVRLETGAKLTVEAGERQRQCGGQKWFEKLAAIAANS